MRKIAAGLVLMISVVLSQVAWCQDEDDPSGPRGEPGQSASEVLKVADYETARQETLAIALKQGARLLHAHTQANGKGRKHGWLRFRMTSAQLTRLLPGIRGVGKIYAEHMTSADHLSEYQEIERRVTRLQAHEKRLSALLDGQRHLRASDTLAIQERLYRAAVDEARLQQRHADLERAMQDSALQVELFEPGSVAASTTPKIDLGQWFQSSWARAQDAFYRRLARGATAGAYALVFAPVWIPIILITVLIGWRLGRGLNRWLRGARLRLALVGLGTWLGASVASGTARLTRIAPRRSSPHPPQNPPPAPPTE